MGVLDERLPSAPWMYGGLTGWGAAGWPGHSRPPRGLVTSVTSVTTGFL